MMKFKLNKLLLIGSLVLMAGQVLAERDPANMARDQYRHPKETLAFFAIQPDMDVIEIAPGAGWYTEFLANYLTGTLYAAHYDPESKRAFFRDSQHLFAEMIAANPNIYSNVEIEIFDAKAQRLTAEDNSADALVTFRNVHNWLRSNSEAGSFKLFYKALKPGGILGVVEHRAVPDSPRASMISSGYVTQNYVIELAERAGFVFEASSEINANPADSADHPKGVWTLPPTLALGDQDRARYLAIGESDRMTLRFRKPSQ